MNRLIIRPFALLLSLNLPGGAGAQPDPAAAQPLLRQAHESYQAGDYVAYTRALETALELNSGSYYTRYSLAGAYALTGEADKSLDLLERLTAARVDFGLAGNADFVSLRALPRFRDLSARLEANTRPTGRGRQLHAFDQLGLIPEGIGHDPTTGRLFFGSMRSGDVFVVDRHGRLSKFAAVEHGGPLAAIGMTVDRERGLLWVVGSSFFLTEGHDPEAPVRSGVFAFELADGALVKKVFGEDVGNGYNDVSIGPDGDVYLSGSVIGTLAPGSERIVPVSTSSAIFGSNGIVATPDGEHLITSSYPVGIAVIRLADGAVRYLAAPAEIPLYGIDGMYWHRGNLIAVQNGLEPWRLVRLELSADLSAVTAAQDIDFANPAMTATTAAIAGNRIHYVGQAPAPEDPPAHVPPALAPYLGKTVIMTADLE